VVERFDGGQAARLLSVIWSIRGFGAQVAALVQDAAFDHLDAPVARVGAPFAPVPFSAQVEGAYLPGANEIVAAVRGLR
jgi:pyruvate dehydrogenase E1 component beta subunit